MQGIRGTISVLAFMVLAALGCSCSSQPVVQGTGSTSQHAQTQPAEAATQPQTTQGSCPTARDFELAINENEQKMAQAVGISASHVAVTLDSEIVCQGWLAAAWVKTHQVNAGRTLSGRTIVVLRQRVDNQKWELLTFADTFYTNDSVCEYAQSRLLQWLRQQQGSHGYASCTKDIRSLDATPSA